MIHDPNAALDQSTAMGWKDVYPPRDKSIPNTNQMARDGYLQEIEAARAESQSPANRTRAKQVREMIQAKLRVV